MARLQEEKSLIESMLAEINTGFGADSGYDSAQLSAELAVCELRIAELTELINDACLETDKWYRSYL